MQIPSWVIFSYHPGSVNTTSTLRVRAWRILKRVGALPLQQSVYIVPKTVLVVGKLTKLRQLIEGDGGQVTWLEVSSFGAESEELLLERFKQRIAQEYENFIQDCCEFSSSALEEPEKEIRRLIKRLKKIRSRDYFDCSLISTANESLAQVELLMQHSCPPILPMNEVPKCSR